MAIRTVGPNSTYASIAAAMADSGPGDTIQLEAGYSNETATILHSGMIVTGEASSTGIVLNLGSGIATVTLAGAAPIDLNDALDGNGIIGNDGDNLITVTGGADSASGGVGDDRLFVDYRLATGAVTGTTANVAEAGGGGRLVTINGGFEHFTIWTGAGADTITTGDGDDDIRTGEGAGTVTAGDGFNTIVGGGGADTVTAGDGGNYVDGGDGANTITTGGGEDEILTGTGDDTIVSGGGADRITITGGADSADAGAGDDLLIVDYSASLTDVTGGVTSGSLAAGYSGHIADLAGATLDFVGVERMDVTTGSGNDTVTTGGGNDTLRGGAGNDRFHLQLGGDDTASGGAGNDAFLVIGALTGADVLDGGDGQDELALQGDYSAGVTLGAVTGIEVMVLLPGSDTRFGAPGTQNYSYSITTTDQNVASGGLLSVDANRLRAGENLVFDGSAETDGSFSIFAGKGVDVLTGGSRNDAFLFRGPGNFTGADTVNGGAGFDELALRGDYTGANKVVFGATTISGIEAIVVISGHDLRYGKEAGDFSFDLTMNEANVQSGQVMIVDAGTLRSGERLVFDGSAETDGGRFTMFGGKGNDSLTGGSGADSIRGGLGADVMKGNGGADTFVFRDTAESPAGTPDHILDFLSGTDKIDLTRIDANSLAGGDQAFSWIGSNAFSGSGSAGQLRAYQSGNDWFVEGDTNGDGNADLVIQLTVTGGPPVQGDFLP